MHRRQFLELTASALVAGAAGGCVASAARAAATGGTRTRDVAGDLGAPLDLKRWIAERRYVRTRSGRVAYVERGNGAAALFLHGFPLSGFQWRGALERLSPQRRCIAPDFLALGYTEVAPGESVAPDAQVAMLVELLDRLGVDTADVVANDSGGAVAQLLAVRHPRRVRTLLLTNCDVEGDSPPAAMRPVIEMAHEGTYPDRWLVPWYEDHALARSPEGLGGMTYGDPAHPTDEAIECYLGPLVATPERKALVNAYAIALERDPLAGIEAALRRSTIPTRIVWGTGDTIFSQASPAYLDRILGDSRGVRRVPGAKLFFPEEYPELIADEARRLWASVGAG